MKIMIIYIL